jgi:hypothetical protein
VNSSDSFPAKNLTITPFQPTQIGIGYEYGGLFQTPAPASDFVYTTG